MEQKLSFQLTQKQVLNCMFQNWYPLFKRLTFTSQIITLPEDFVSFLQEDNIFVEEKDWIKRQKEEDRYDVGEEAWQDETEELTSRRKFPELEQKIKEAIEDLGGEVFPKLNWSSPKDATWMMTSSTLRCITPTDIILLLKSSDLITYDLTSTYEN